MAGENVNRRLNIYINDREVTNSLTGVTREMSKVRAQMRGLNKGAEDYQEQLDKLNKEYQDLEEVQSQFKKDIYGVKKGFDDTKKSAEEMTGELDAAGSAFGNLWEGLKTGNMKQAQEGLNGLKTGLQESAKAGLAFVSTPIGAVIAGLVVLGASVKALWDYNAGLTEMNNKLSSLGVSSQELSKVRSEVAATAETFGKEFDEIAEKANSLAKTYGISMTEANDIIAQGLANGGAQNGEFLNSLGEYDEFFAKAGYSAKQFVDVINTGYDLGIYDDKLPDALKEADLSLKEQTKSTRDALINAFGASFTNDILQKVRTGEMTTKEALDAIAVKSQEVGLSQQQQAQLTADVFRGAGEDAGGAQKILDAVAQSAKRNMSESAKATDDLRLANERLNEAQAELFEIDGFGDTWTKIKTAGIDAFAAFLEGIAEFKTDIQPIIDLVSIVFANAWEGIKFTVSNAFEIIGGYFKFFGNIIKTGINVITKLFKGDFGGALDAATDGLKNAAKIIGNVFIGLKNNLLTALSNIIENVAPMLEALGLDVDKIKKKLESWKSQKFELKGEVKVKGTRDPGNPEGNTKTKETTKDNGNADEKSDALKRAEAAKKAAEERKKLLEAQAKEREALDKQLLATQRAFQDAQLDLMADGYEKEKAKINLEHDRKIEDLRSHLFKESELKDLQNQIDAAKNSGNNNEAQRLQALLNQKLEINKAYNDSIVASEQTRNLKIAQLQEKYLAEEFKKEQEVHARQLKNLQTQQNYELNGITSLKEAKALLSETMSSDELKRVTTLEQAKKLIKEQHLKEQYEMEKANLEKIATQIQALMALDAQSGFQLFSDEERDAVLKNLEEVQNKISGLKKPPESEEGPKTFDNAANTGVDILGFDAGKWEALFDGLDTFAEKLTAVQMVAGALKQAFNAYFAFMEAGENRTLQKFQKSTDAKKRALADQLEKGYITQEVYNARIAQADEELNRKKADLEYKQAKRKRAMAIVEAIINTAQAISGALAATPGPGGIIMAAIVGAFGALQIATIARQPLPDKGYKTGGFTTRGNKNEIAGVTHKDEYVIPADVLYDNDPAMPSIMEYVEGKRTGKIKPGSQSSDNIDLGSAGGQSSNNELFLAKVIERNSNLLQKILEEGIAAWLELDLPTAKRIRKKLQELEIIEKLRKK
ncbi:hypothetical protein G6N05_05470 [Flavobacterium sp. F372]|uniref:Phage tail tape measure protein n=1 Tax=Flavobacterium bernardetii TaxID=2813823 RepID=A0ABR7J1B9_9FLAO|nr:phage tail tape measure protein [Flavobacterium bernardetii]MBC5835830.1 phage tail tape measure protein [Flavobacterium bernardetii]NHF69560.1 hypothetical protein [Flavobacterium bernardetii]